MSNETKELVIGTHTFTLVQLDPWRRLTFVADLQKEFLAPMLKNRENNDFSNMFSGTTEGNGADIMSIVSAFSGAVDSKSIEKWMRRILADGLVIYTREDGQRAKLGFSELNKFFTNPTDILMVLKEAIVFNMLDINELVSAFQGTKSAARVTEA